MRDSYQSKLAPTQLKYFVHPLVVKAFIWIEVDTKDAPV